MSLGVAVKGPEGIVLAADSRVTVEFTRINNPTDKHRVNYDNATKLLAFPEHNYVGVVTYGSSLIGNRIVHSFIPEIEPKLGACRLPVCDVAKRLSDFFSEQWQKNMKNAGPTEEVSFIVGGFDPNAPYGRVFIFSIPNHPDPSPRNENDFGMTWGGQLEIASRVIQGYDPALLQVIKGVLGLDDSKLAQLKKMLDANMAYNIPYEVLPLQDCIYLATFLIRTTMTAQNLSVGIRGVGGVIEVAAITRTEGLRWVKKKELRGEIQS